MMCGIAGFVDPKKRDGAKALRASAARMSDALIHRGPDDDGQWVDAEAGIALGHRRLAIVDLSPQGHQPMVSASGRYVLAFNGEMYNYQGVRAELEQAPSIPIAAGRNEPGCVVRGTDSAISIAEIRWRGHSDTEVLLEAISRLGLLEAVRRFVGMFAFVLWDRKERELHLVRDRLGEKPLYYGWMGDIFLFGSELKALRAHSAWRGEIDRGSLALLMRHNYVPAPYSIYRNVFKVLPGTILSMRFGRGSRPEVQTTVYWSAREVAENGVAEPYEGSERDAVVELDTLLRSAVTHQMVADVPVGAFLSGGVDSSAIVALMQAQSARPVRTFTIGFEEARYNEAEHSKAVARHLGTDHTELYVTAADAMAVIPKLPTLYDEPFSDSSQIPTYLVSQLARRHVTVSLSGDAGDELFGGYNRYFLGRDIWNKIGWLPRPLRGALAAGIRAVPPAGWQWAIGAVPWVVPARLNVSHRGDKLHKLAEILATPGPDEMYRRLVSHWHQPEQLVIGAKEPLTSLTDKATWARLSGFMQRMMYLDTVSYLPDDILVKIDRAAMAVSLESRVPLLDHRVVEFAWRVPLSMKIRAGQGKWLLRQVLYRYVPRALIERPKMGFGLPIGMWLSGSLRDWAEDLLDEKRLTREGFFNPDAVQRKWREHLSGERNWQYHLWDVLMFQAWLRTETAA